VDSASGSEVVIRLPSVLGYEHVAVGAAAAYARMHDFSAERIEDLKTIVAEATTNAVRHGNAGSGDARVVISFTSTADAVIATVFDEGKGFVAAEEDPEPQEVRQDRDRPGGYGLFLIRRLADGVAFRVLADGHAVEMVLYRNP
jgi:anti-sigma regulatory factor (Ser/Thr protein kinase)